MGDRKQKDENAAGASWRGKPFYSPAEAAKALGVTRRSVDRYLADGLLHAVKVGGKWRIAEKDIDAFIKSGANFDPLTAELLAPLDYELPEVDLSDVPGMDLDLSDIPGMDLDLGATPAAGKGKDTKPRKDEGKAMAATCLRLLQAFEKAAGDLRKATAEAKSLAPKIEALAKAAEALTRATGLLSEAAADARGLSAQIDRLATALEKAALPVQATPQAPAASKPKPKPEPPRVEPPRPPAPKDRERGLGMPVPTPYAVRNEPHWKSQDRSRK